MEENGKKVEFRGTGQIFFESYSVNDSIKVDILVTIPEELVESVRDDKKGKRIFPVDKSWIVKIVRKNLNQDDVNMRLFPRGYFELHATGLSRGVSEWIVSRQPPGEFWELKGTKCIVKSNGEYWAEVDVGEDCLFCIGGFLSEESESVDL